MDQSSRLASISGLSGLLSRFRYCKPACPAVYIKASGMWGKSDTDLADAACSHLFVLLFESPAFPSCYFALHTHLSGLQFGWIDDFASLCCRPDIYWLYQKSDNEPTRAADWPGHTILRL